MQEDRRRLIALKAVLHYYAAAFGQHIQEPENDEIRNEMIVWLSEFREKVRSSDSFSQLGDEVWTLHTHLQRLNMWFPRGFKVGWFQFENIRWSAAKGQLSDIDWSKFKLGFTPTI